jgi:histidinol dehydrogenase
MKQYIWSELSPLSQADILKRPMLEAHETLQKDVREILSNIQENGDDALYAYAVKFKELQAGQALKISQDHIENAERSLNAAQKQSIDTAFDTIYAYHQQQGFKEFGIETMAGVSCQRIVRPIEKVGLYVPAGSAPLISTMLMLGIPSLIAKCPVRIVCTPSDHPAILYAASRCGIRDIFQVGGAHAIAAMAFGTQTIPPVHKIFGPGNAYVTEAKKQAAQLSNAGIAIDMPAGASEVCVIADHSTNPVFAAADLLSQAEHDPSSQVLLIATAHDIADKIEIEVKRQMAKLPRHDIAAKAIKNSCTLIADTINQAIDIANLYAPEHLILQIENPALYVDKIIHAGSIFLGHYTPESAGDYASGTNHVLPTSAYARSYSGLSVEAFQKTISVQSITQQGLKNLSDTIINLAEMEGLKAHANAVRYRVES